MIKCFKECGAIGNVNKINCSQSLLSIPCPYKKLWRNNKYLIFFEGIYIFIFIMNLTVPIA